MSLLLLIELALIIRILLLPRRQPASRIAWIVVVAALPVGGILAYLLFGEANIGRRRVARVREVIKEMPDFPEPHPVTRQISRRTYLSATYTCSALGSQSTGSSLSVATRQTCLRIPMP